MIMEAELQEALQVYESSLADVQEVLRQLPDDADTLKLEAELLVAISDAREALAAQQGQRQQQQQEEGATEASPPVGSSGGAGPGLEQGVGIAPEIGPQAPGPPVPRALGGEQQQPQQGSRKRPREATAAACARGRKNHLIHPRNRYAYEEPDFEALAREYPSLEPYLLPLRGGGGGAVGEYDGGGDGGEEGTGAGAGEANVGAGGAVGDGDGGGSGGAEQRQKRRRGRVVDFADEEAARELTKVLLHADFGIDWWVPLGQLVPPLTNRANYVHWLEDLLALSSPPDLPRVRGLDVGCGANCIYPLLGSAANGWDFVAADVTDVALGWAARNVAANPHLPGRIEVRRSGGGGGSGDGNGGGGGSGGAGGRKEAGEVVGTEGILPPCVRRGERFSFTMCNPPFFGSMREAGANPNTAYSGSEAEMVYPGGELAFVSQMVADSASPPLRGAAHWFTSMLGKKATLKALRRALYRAGVTALRTTEFCQGRTSRWAIAWSFEVDPARASQPLPSMRSAAAAAATAAAAPPIIALANPAAAAAAPEAAAAAAEGGGCDGYGDAGDGVTAGPAGPAPAPAAAASQQPRGVRGAAAAAGKREHSFTVRATPGARGAAGRGQGQAPLRLLQLLSSVLDCHGVRGCSVDAATYTLQGELPLPPGGLAAAATAAPQLVAAHIAAQLFQAGNELTVRLRLSTTATPSPSSAAARAFAALAPLAEADVRQMWQP